MDPVCFHIGQRPVHWYGVMMAAGFVAGLIHWMCLARREKLPAGFSSDLGFWVMLSGIAGARLAYVFANLGEYWREPWLILRVDQGGLIYYGGFAGAGVALLLFARRRGVRPLWLLDFTLTAVPLAHAFGRIGCAINGCCYGRLTTGWLRVVYPRGTGPWWDQYHAGLIPAEARTTAPMFPVQWLEAGFNLLLYGVLLAVYRRGRRPGRAVLAYLCLYPLGRFLLEFLRGDARLRVAGLDVAQWSSLVLLAGAAVFWCWWRQGNDQTLHD